MSFPLKLTSVQSKRKFLANGGSIIMLALCLAQAKAGAASRLCKSDYCLGADQTLIVGKCFLHKSPSFVEAASSLAALSGRTHRLTSGLCIARSGKPLVTESDRARLHMLSLDESQIFKYLNLVGPDFFSSVGVYQLERLGVHLFDRIDGYFSTILSLPMLKLLARFRQQGPTSIMNETLRKLYRCCNASVQKVSQELSRRNMCSAHPAPLREAHVGRCR